MPRYKIATKTDTLRYKIAKEVFNEIEDSDGVRDIPSWEIFEKCLEQHKRIAELEEQLKNARKETAKKVIARVEELGVFDFEAYEERYIISEKELDNILKEYGE